MGKGSVLIGKKKVLRKKNVLTLSPRFSLPIADNINGIQREANEKILQLTQHEMSRKDGEWGTEYITLGSFWLPCLSFWLCGMQQVRFCSSLSFLIFF